MAKTFQLDIITPTEIISEGQVEYLRAPSTDGLFGVAKGHVSAMILLEIGEIKITKKGQEYYYATNGGFADIRPESVMLLVETAEKNTEIIKDRVEKSIKRAEERLKDINNNKTDLSRINFSLARARNRLKVLKRNM